MKKVKTTYTVLAILLTLTSCAEQEPENTLNPADGVRIYFRSYLPGISQTRAEVVSNDNLTECRATCFNLDDTSLIDPGTGKITPYFSNSLFVKDADGRFILNGDDEYLWPSDNQRLHFFAFYPSVETMRNNIDGSGFNLVNNSVEADGASHIDYRLEKFIVAPEISDQIDFIAATTIGTREENGADGIALNFGHQLARIELSAWCSNQRYSVEIAGVRVGNALTQGDFCFSETEQPTEKAGNWINTAGHQACVEHIFTAGETTVMLDGTKGYHTSPEQAASIMGNAGSSMVIPMQEKIEAWEGINNQPASEDGKSSTDKLYFSVLLRAQEKSGDMIFPYPDDSLNIPKIYFAVEPDGKIKKRVYLIDGDYYISEDKNEELIYTPGPSEEIRVFCWAALPVTAKWDAGKIYSYKLNYSHGIGLHDPADPEPGTPILNGRVIINVEVSDWIDGDMTDVTVPRK